MRRVGALLFGSAAAMALMTPNHSPVEGAAAQIDNPEATTDASVGSYETLPEDASVFSVTVELSGVEVDQVRSIAPVARESSSAKPAVYAAAPNPYQAKCQAAKVKPSFTSDCDKNGIYDLEETTVALLDIKQIGYDTFVNFCLSRGVYPDAEADCNGDRVADAKEPTNFNAQIAAIRFSISNFYKSCSAKGAIPSLYGDCGMSVGGTVDGYADMLQLTAEQDLILSAIVNEPITPSAAGVPELPNQPNSTTTTTTTKPPARPPITPTLQRQIAIQNEIAERAALRAKKALSGGNVPPYATSFYSDKDNDGSIAGFDPDSKNKGVTPKNDNVFKADNTR